MATTLVKLWQPPRTEAGHSLPPDLPPAVAQILVNRGIDTAAKLQLFLEPPQRLPYDPLRLAGMDRALARLYKAVNSKERVGVFGDFDVDGVTGAAIIAEGLTPLEIQVIPYLPRRTGEGHGLSTTAIDTLVGQGVSLIVTVDCGVTAVDEVAWARQAGADVIITDHHVPHGAMPEAVAVLDPKLPGGNYPFHELCGAGLAFKLMQGLYEFYGQPWGPGLLELAALGTIADLVPLVDENRFLVQQGLKALSQTNRPGLQALYRRAGIQTDWLNTETVSFQIAPRLNSSGRMSHALESYRLLTTGSATEAEELADRLEGLNYDRRGLSEEAFAIAYDQVCVNSNNGMLPILLVEDSRIGSAVAGLVAGRLAELFHRPSVVMSSDGDHLIASGRSIPEFNLVEAFGSCSELLLRYGGHSQAAGFTLDRDNLPALTESLTALAGEVLGSKDLRPKLTIDAEVQLADLTDQLLQWLTVLAPFGPGNPTPVFLTRRVEVLESRFMGSSRQHFALKVRDGPQQWTALAFNLGERWDAETARVDLVFTVTNDHWRGPGAMALRVLDFRQVPR